MIQIELSSLIAAFLFTHVVVIFLFWFRQKTLPINGIEKKLKGTMFQCKVCMHLFVRSSSAAIAQCPLCQSFFAQGNE